MDANRYLKKIAKNMNCKLSTDEKKSGQAKKLMLQVQVQVQVQV